MVFRDPDAPPSPEEKQLAHDLHEATLKGEGFVLQTARQLRWMGWYKVAEPGPVPDGVVVLRKRAVTVHAMRWTGENLDALHEWTDCNFQRATGAASGKRYTAMVWVAANDNWATIETGEWVLRDSKGFYPCKADLVEGPDAVYDIEGKASAEAEQGGPDGARTGPHAGEHWSAVWDAYTRAYQEYQSRNRNWKAYYSDHHRYALDEALRIYDRLRSGTNTTEV